MSELVFRDVWKRFSGREVLSGFSARIPLTGITFLIGKSGSGKSVLCRLAVGLLSPDSGEIIASGQEITQLSEKGCYLLRKSIPYLVQAPALLDWLTVEENIGLAGRDLPIATSRLRTQEAIERFHLTTWANKLPPQLGSGLKKRVAIARAWVLQPKAFLLDEPTTGLDAEATEQVYDALKELRQQGMGAVIVSHDYVGMQHLADHIVVIGAGKVAFAGNLEEFLDSTHPEAVELKRPAELRSRGLHTWT